MCADHDDNPNREGDVERTVIVKCLRRVFAGFLSIDEAIVEFPRHDGVRQTVRRQSLERGDSVAVALVDVNRRVIWLAEQFRFPTLSKNSGWLVEIPAGMIDDDETPVAAAERETFEETGFTVTALEQVATFYVSPGGTSERVILFYGIVDGLLQNLADAKGKRDRSEDIRLIEQNLDTFFEDCSHGRIEDGKTLLAGLWMQVNRSRLGV